jgi:hypothetical protein
LPQWLEELLKPPPVRFEEHTADIPLAPGRIIAERTSKTMMGSPLSRHPYLACRECNGRWMNRFEGEMQKFKPLFTGVSPVTLDSRSLRVLSVWIGLATILAEWVGAKGTVSIPSKDRFFIKKYRALPETWAVVGCSLEGSDKWKATHERRFLWISDFSSLSHYHGTVMSGELKRNTQISSFGFGKVFIQTFSCPDLRQVQNFKIAARSTGLTQLWPPPTSPDFSNRISPAL